MARLFPPEQPELNPLVVQLTTAAAGDMVQILVALEATALRRLTWPDGGASCSTVTPFARASAASAAIPALVGTSIVRPAAVVATPSPHTAAPDGARSITVPAVPSGARATARVHEGREASRGHRESGHLHHASHVERAQVEAAGRAGGVLSIGRREVSVRVGVCPRRCDVRRIDNVRVDQLKLRKGLIMTVL